MVSDLTPEEARASDLLWQAYEEQDWKLVRSLVRDVRALEDDALAAVAAERERLGERLLSDEAVEAAEAHRWTYADGAPGGSWANMPAALSAAWRVVTGSNA